MGHAAVTRLRLSADHTALFTCSADGAVCVLDVQDKDFTRGVKQCAPACLRHCTAVPAGKVMKQTDLTSIALSGHVVKTNMHCCAKLRAMMGPEALQGLLSVVSYMDCLLLQHRGQQAGTESTLCSRLIHSVKPIHGHMHLSLQMGLHTQPDCDWPHALWLKMGCCGREVPLYAEETLVIKAEVDEKRQRIADLELQACGPSHTIQPQ